MSGFVSFCRIPPGGLPLGSSRSLTLHRSSVKYDPLVRSITMAFGVGLIALNIFIIYAALTQIPHPFLASLLVTMTVMLTLGVLLGTYLFSPRGFELSLRGIIVKRHLRSFEIPYEEIIEAKRVKWTWKGIRLCASGGLYGFFGLFYLKGIGKVWAYVTSRNDIILLRTKRGIQYMLSPEDPEVFLEKLNTLIRMSKK